MQKEKKTIYSKFQIPNKVPFNGFNFQTSNKFHLVSEHSKVLLYIIMLWFFIAKNAFCSTNF